MSVNYNAYYMFLLDNENNTAGWMEFGKICLK